MEIPNPIEKLILISVGANAAVKEERISEGIISLW
jgi:hypothetical protein